MPRRILSDRLLCMHERYQSSMYNEEIFREIWGERPRAIKIRVGPKCLNRPEMEEEPSEDLRAFGGGRCFGRVFLGA